MLEKVLTHSDILRYVKGLFLFSRVVFGCFGNCPVSCLQRFVSALQSLAHVLHSGGSLALCSAYLNQNCVCHCPLFLLGLSWQGQKQRA